MNKMVRILLALGLILALAAPAFAEFKLNGYYRLMGYSGELKSTTDEDGDSRQTALQRLRMQLTYSLNDNVSIVYFGEVDTDWGVDSATKGPGGDGAFGADGVNLETKNAYLDLKFGDTTARLGIQGIADNVDGIVVNADMAGVNVNHKIGNTSLQLAYSKWYENNASDWDDVDFYQAVVNQKFSDSFKGGLGLYFVDNNNVSATQTSEFFFVAPRVTFSTGNFTVDGFVVYQDGTTESDVAGVDDLDSQAYVGSLKGSMKIDGGDINLRFIYGSEDDEDDEDNAWKGDYDQYAFVTENQMIMLIDPYVTNWPKEQYAVNDSLKTGYGLMAFVLSGNHKLPSDMYFKWGAGYYMAADDTAAIGLNGADVEREGDTIGYELCARVGKRYFEKVDVSLNAAFADFGDFYDNTVNGNDDPNSIYKAYLMVNVPF